MYRILLLNPNTNSTTTHTMVGLLQAALPMTWHVTARTATQGVPLIDSAEQLHACSDHVLDMWRSDPYGWDAIVVSSFGDPCVEQLRRLTKCPVIGLGEASVLAASAGGRRFGIATVTPKLADPIRALVQRLGVAHLYTGLSNAPGQMPQLLNDHTQLKQALHYAAQACVQLDGAQAIIVGGGPLGNVALALQSQQARYGAPVIAPLSATAQWLQNNLPYALPTRAGLQPAYIDA